tara:strand:+ start:11020 stop:11787 length:768 start_codon:yes stop_codon:yes gene_type:complete
MIVCEIGLNHLGSEEYSDYYLDILLSTQCDAITYQIREPDFYKKLNNRDNFRPLPIDAYKKIINRIQSKNKKAGIALADHTLLDKFNELGADFYKVLSWDLSNYDFIDKILDCHKPVYISTGMSNIEEIKDLCNRYQNHPFKNLITLIHTQLSYYISDTNLKAINYLKRICKTPIAFGNHCENINVIYTSVAMEPSDYFIYVKGNTAPKHPDEHHAININSISKVVDNILCMNTALGTEIKLKMTNKIDEENLTI